jgi:hypothetical protein
MSANEVARKMGVHAYARHLVLMRCVSKDYCDGIWAYLVTSCIHESLEDIKQGTIHLERRVR